MARPLKALISTAALQHNLRQVKEKAQGAKIMAMVKANAYGHGLVQVSKILESLKVDALGVACIEEAIQLREAGIQTDIVLMEGFFEPAELTLIVRWGLIAVIHHPEQVKILLAAAAGSSHCSGPLRIWLKVDTGMHRLGLPTEKTAAIWSQLTNCGSGALPISVMGFMTHFAVAESQDPVHMEYTQEQMVLFQRTVGHLPGQRSLSNSAGILAWPAACSDWIRPGLMLYGASPLQGKQAKDLNLKPVMQLKSALIAIHALKKGDQLGYGLTYACDEDMPVGIVALGYGDGFSQQAPAGTCVMVGSQVTQLIGRVSMDMLAVDLRPCKDPFIGQAVEFWGQELAIETVATAMKTSPYELLASFSHRVPLLMV